MANQNQALSPIAKVRAFLQSVLSSAQLAQIDQILSGVDTETDPPAPTALQPGGTEAGAPPAQAQRRMGRDALPGRGPTDADQNRPTGFDRRMARDAPPPFPGRPQPGGGRDPFRQEVSGFAHDSITADRELRRRLRMAGHPLGDQGGPGTALSYAKACGLGHLAMDAAPQPSGDANAGLEAASRISELSYMGRMIHSDPPRAPGHGMAYDQASDPLSLGAMMPGLAARFAIQEANEHRAFAVARSTPDDRFPRRRSRGGGVPMAYDSRPAGRSAAPSISAVFGPELAARLDGIGFVR